MRLAAGRGLPLPVAHVKRNGLHVDRLDRNLELQALRLRQQARAVAKPARTGYWLMYQPPFGDSTWPVTKPACSLARYTAAQAMSSGTPKRPIGVCIAIIWR